MRSTIRVRFDPSLEQIASILAIEHEDDFQDHAPLTRRYVDRLVRDHFWLHGVSDIDVDNDDAYAWAADEVVRLWPEFGE